MKENLTTLIKKIPGEIGKMFELPTYEEAMADFKHRKNCSQNLPLQIRIKKFYIEGVGFAPGIAGQISAIECDECGSYQGFDPNKK